MITSNISDDFGEYDNDDQLTVREVAICRSSWNQRMKNTYMDGDDDEEDEDDEDGVMLKGIKGKCREVQPEIR